MEIERKWLIKGFPTDMYKINSERFIEQSYLYTDPEIRILHLYNFNSDTHDYDHEYRLTVKSDGDLSREEIELNIPNIEYRKILDMINKKSIQKNYRTYEFAGFTIEMSQVDNLFYYAEVEFKSEDEARQFTFPFSDIVIKEITEDSEYKMKNYWKRTRL